jgi:hypothetical protein
VSYKIHLHRVLGLTFCNRKIRGNVTRKLSSVTCLNCKREYDKHVALIESFRSKLGVDFLSQVFPEALEN